MKKVKKHFSLELSFIATWVKGSAYLYKNNPKKVSENKIKLKDAPKKRKEYNYR